MQEFVFTVTYDKGSDPIADVLIAYPDIVMTLLDCSVTEDSVWFLNRITGPAAALERLDDIFLDPTHCNECLSAELCDTQWTYELLSSGENSRTVYSYGTDGEDCHSIPGLGVTHLGDGLVHDAERRGDQYRWRILVPEDAELGDLYDTIHSGLRDGLRLSLDHLKEPTRWGDTVVSLADVPYEQRTMLREAVERGYYETPRGITTQELADELDIPQSTVQYRLSRAEAWLATEFASEVAWGRVDDTGT
ncbi:helix-turn-helix domain-containing protein [Haloarcula sp. S1CR25-12]|uniref:Helix-turn-helix domain-containing protein n=1 Tax=Haloarcula saliterrae TaxID=2950534 RepID=A0ABU2F8R1_9EURY|nr:helix-turn-helix domain-containing protein [Haloarcula sp. S1CR25-12]MDS0258125.1 helix-turn-helix domain-containing protein [Haloarcula sp. S1CR25-12]